MAPVLGQEGFKKLSISSTAMPSSTSPQPQHHQQQQQRQQQQRLKPVFLWTTQTTVVVPLTLLLLTLIPLRCGGAEPGASAINILFNKFKTDPRVRPVKQYNDTLVITVSLVLQHIFDLDEKHQLLESTFCYEFNWKVSY